MSKHTKYRKIRERFIKDTSDETERKVKGLQAGLWGLVSNVIGTLDRGGDGKIKNTLGNMRRAERAKRVVSGFNKSEGKGLVNYLFKKLVTLAGFNNKYATAMPGVDNPNDEVMKKVLFAYGYDLEQGSALSTGYLSGIFNSTEVAGAIGKQMSDAIGSGMSLAEFQNRFYQRFVNPQGQGMLEWHYYRFTRDLYGSFDRSMQMQLKERLGMQYFIYSGTAIKTTRDFCEHRINNIYHESVFDLWNRQDWAGKIKGQPVELYLGGYNCRHTISWVSDLVANEIIKTKGLSVR